MDTVQALAMTLLMGAGAIVAVLAGLFLLFLPFMIPSGFGAAQSGWRRRRYRNDPVAQSWLAVDWPLSMLPRAMAQDQVSAAQWREYADATDKFLSVREVASCMEVGITPAHLHRFPMSYLAALIDAVRHDVPVEWAVEVLRERDADALDELGVTVALAKALPGWFPGRAVAGDAIRWITDTPMSEPIGQVWMELFGGRNVEVLRGVLAPAYAALGADASWFAAAGFILDEAKAMQAEGPVDREALAVLVALANSVPA